MEDFFYGSFNLIFHEGSSTGYLTVHPEMVPSGTGIKPLGSYFVYSIHPTCGSFTFIMKQDKDCKWFCETKPSFIADAFIGWVGTQIEIHGRHHNCHSAQ
ncbi:MAG: hypothetical protein INR73_20120 [Williamsia sp.]|nr:hypothetical protein [Williamsia sp.]